MSKGHRITTRLLLTSLCVALSGCVLTPREPLYQDKRLSVWLKEVEERGLQAVPELCRASRDSNAGVAKAAGEAIERLGIEVRDGAVVRGPVDRKRIALVFTAHEFAEGGEVILNELELHKAKASFFLTGDFVRNARFSGLIQRLRKSGHQVGPHSDKHLLYCSWGKDRETLVTSQQFETDLNANLEALQKSLPGRFYPYLLPPYEHYNQEIADWAQTLRLILVNFTPGTRSTADYTGEADRNFVPSKEIFESILVKERGDAHGLNGFILLLHLGAGPRRADKFHGRFGELLEGLSKKGYEFVTVNDLLARPL